MSSSLPSNIRTKFDDWILISSMQHNLYDLSFTLGNFNLQISPTAKISLLWVWETLLYIAKTSKCSDFLLSHIISLLTISFVLSAEIISNTSAWYSGPVLEQGFSFLLISFCNCKWARVVTVGVGAFDFEFVKESKSKY